MKVEETTIVWDKNNPQVPMLLHRAGDVYILHNAQDRDMPLRHISKEEAWDLLNIPESMRNLLRKF